MKTPWYETDYGCIALLAGSMMGMVCIIAFVLWLIGRG